MGQNASKSKSELKTTESLRMRLWKDSFNVLIELQRLQTEIRERTEMETEMNQADDNKSDEKVKIQVLFWSLRVTFKDEKKRFRLYYVKEHKGRK